nr:phosphomannomutase/phosphoglucomutase [bacterium]
MDIQALQALISGSDIRGEAMPHQGCAVNLTPDAVQAWATGFAAWLKGKTGKQQVAIGVGRDMRLTSPQLQAAAINGLKLAGCRVIDCGICTTPGMFMTTVHPKTHFDGAIMITASHHPAHRNGMKFFTPDGGLDKPDLMEMSRLALEPADAAGACEEKFDFMPLYIDWMVDTIRLGIGAPFRYYEKPMADLRIVVDAGNGLGAFFVEVLERLGADTRGSICLEPDGSFPDGIHNPEEAHGLDALCAAVVKNKADFGVLFDPDCDRAAAVDDDGTPIARNRLIALISLIALADCPGGTIVTDSLASSGVTEFIQKHGGVHRRVRRGYRVLINEMVRINQAGGRSPLAIETSGHAAFQRHYNMDDGAYLVARMLIRMGRTRFHSSGAPFKRMIADLKEPAEEIEVRLPITARPFRPAAQAAFDKLAAYARTADGWTLDEENEDGVKAFMDANHGDGWFIMRPSVHDPVLPINFEADNAGGSLAMAAELLKGLQGVEGVDLKPLEQFVNQGH